MTKIFNAGQNAHTISEHISVLTGGIPSFSSVIEPYILPLGYIGFIFTLTLIFLATRSLLKGQFWSRKYRLPNTFNQKLWRKVHEDDEAISLARLEELFENQPQKRPPIVQFSPVGMAVLSRIISGISHGYDNQRILRECLPNVAQIDALPLIDALRSFRDFCARKILSDDTKNKHEYALALRELSSGKPQKAVQILRKELIMQEKSLFSLKTKLLQQYAKKEAGRMALFIGLIAGVYDVKLAEKAYRRSMELLPKSQKNIILYGRFRQRSYGDKDILSRKAFLGVGKKLTDNLNDYMKNYAKEMVRKANLKEQQEEIKARITDEKERYAEQVRIQRLKMHEALRLARVRVLTDEIREHV